MAAASVSARTTRAALLRRALGDGVGRALVGAALVGAALGGRSPSPAPGSQRPGVAPVDATAVAEGGGCVVAVTAGLGAVGASATGGADPPPHAVTASSVATGERDPHPQRWPARPSGRGRWSGNTVASDPPPSRRWISSPSTSR